MWWLLVACQAPEAPAPGAPGLAVEQPWNANELAIAVTFDEPSRAAVVCTSLEDAAEAHLVESDRAASLHELRLAGLLADHEYDCTAWGVSPVTAPASRRVRTPSLSDPRLPTVRAEILDPAAGQEYVLANHSRDCFADGHRLLVMDRAGAIRWHGAALPNVGPSLEFTFAGEDLFTWGGGWLPHPGGRPRDIEMYGGATRFDTGPALAEGGASRFHHDGKRLADGRYLTLEAVDVVDGDRTFEGFRVRRVDPVTNAVDFEYHSQRAFDEGRLPGGRGDAWHPNWIDVDLIDGEEVLLVSLCYLSQVVAIDVETGAWRWSLGPDGDFAVVDEAGRALPEAALTQCQHGLQYDSGRLLMYDNGVQRGASRVVEFELDETAMVAQRRWEWSEPDWFETTLGSVDWMPDGRVLVDMAHADCFSSNQGDRNTFVELDVDRGVKLWEAQYEQRSAMSYRADWADPCELFANARYCETVAERIAELASGTPQL